ncbi:hypothetical protein DVH24_011089 [Malus domestica]|uniref:Uncharacterized protein n=1 Tax=Malus domestica TaxID=3750 RepID=A0A498JY96_MALDO|nr:hypothetical protein DVH24_011089 [Malus domestica]
MLGILRQKVGAGSSSAMILGQRIRPATSAMRGFASSVKKKINRAIPEALPSSLGTNLNETSPDSCGLSPSLGRLSEAPRKPRDC